MIAGVPILLFVWAGVLFVLSVVTTILTIRYFRKGKFYHDQQKALLVEAEKRVRMQYNKIASLSPNRLITYLGGIFSRFLELSGELGSRADRDVIERLHANALAETLNYLGPETIEAIEYYYGEEYVEKWADLAMRILEKRRELGNVVDGSTRYEDIERILASEMSVDDETMKPGA